MNRDSVRQWPTGHRATATRGGAVAPVRRPWPHQSGRDAFKTPRRASQPPFLRPLSLPVARKPKPSRHPLLLRRARARATPHHRPFALAITSASPPSTPLTTEASYWTLGEPHCLLLRLRGVAGARHGTSPWPGVSGPSPSPLSSKMEPPGLGEARTELQPYRASSPATVRRHRRSPAATHGGRSSPPHPRLSYGCQSMRRVTEITRSCSVGERGLFSGERGLTGARRASAPLLPVADRGGPRVSAARGRESRAGQERARGSCGPDSFSRAGPVVRNKIWVLLFWYWFLWYLEK
jgi:hypothetical protein